MVVLQSYGQSYFNKVYDYDQSNLYNNAASTSYECSNGDFLISSMKFYSASFSALHFIRINSFGDTLFSKRYKKSNCAYYVGLSGSLIKCYDGNLVQAGSFYDSTLSQPDMLLIKLTENGDTLWTKTYGGNDTDGANMVFQTLDSGFVLVGATNSYGGGYSDFYIVKTDKDGNFQWQKTYGNISDEVCYVGQVTLDGGFILSGEKNNKLYIVKTDSNGTFQWERFFGATAGYGFIKQYSDSTYALAGAKYVTSTVYKAYMTRLTKTGGTIWEQTYGFANLIFYAIPIILDDGCIVCSGSNNYGTNPWGFLLKVDSLGNEIWLRSYYANSGNHNYIYDVKQTSDSGFIMTGSGNIMGQDAWVVKVDSAGCEIVNCNVGVEVFQVQSSVLQVYPNPATSEINISIEGEDINEYEISVNNILGECQKIKIAHSIIDISDLASGVYFITAIKENKRFVCKFIKH